MGGTYLALEIRSERTLRKVTFVLKLESWNESGTVRAKSRVVAGEMFQVEGPASSKLPKSKEDELGR